MKKITLIALMLFTALGYAQVGINTNNPDASSALEIESTTGGILIPRLTETQRDAISAPATGLMIYQTNGTSGFYFYDGNIWTKVDGVDGPQGTDGADGTNGTDGLPGTDGTNGTDGTDGVDGQDGQDGQDGTDGVDGTNGTDGVDGTNGTDGADGIDGTHGTDGTNGNGITSTIDNYDGTLTYNYTDGTTFTTSILRGGSITENTTITASQTLVINGSNLTITIGDAVTLGTVITLLGNGTDSYVLHNGNGGFSLISPVSSTIIITTGYQPGDIVAYSNGINIVFY